MFHTKYNLTTSQEEQQNDTDRRKTQNKNQTPTAERRGNEPAPHQQALETD